MKREIIEVMLISLEARRIRAVDLYQYDSSLKHEMRLLEAQINALHNELGKMQIAHPSYVNSSGHRVSSIPLDKMGEPKITNEMKGACIGEFSWTENVSYYDEFGELYECQCINEVPWNLCKKIYKVMAKVAMESTKE